MVTGPDLPVMLVSMGRKAVVRALIIIMQRADAADVDGLVRAQCAVPVSFFVDSGEAVRMCHPAVENAASWPPRPGSAS